MTPLANGTKPALSFDVELNFPQVLSAPHIMRVILGRMSAVTVKLPILPHDSWRNASCTAGEYRAKSNASVGLLRADFLDNSPYRKRSDAYPSLHCSSDRQKT